MGEYELFLLIDYDILSDVFCFGGTIKDEKISDTIEDFLRLQIGLGEDTSEREDHDLYQINLKLDLSCDGFTIFSNCGNLGLRDGILRHFLKKLKETEC
ncbi:MAG: hypothetical protein ABII97_02980 [Patescibacteria group bacterium]